jgi:hypothetical protein
MRQLAVHLPLERIHPPADLSENESEDIPSSGKIRLAGLRVHRHRAQEVDQRHRLVEELLVELLDSQRSKELELGSRSEHGSQISVSSRRRAIFREGEWTQGLEVSMPADRRLEVCGCPAFFRADLVDRSDEFSPASAREQQACNQAGQADNKGHRRGNANWPPHLHATRVSRPDPR